MDLSGVLILASLLIGLLVVVMLAVLLRRQEATRRELAQLRARLHSERLLTQEVAQASRAARALEADGEQEPVSYDRAAPIHHLAVVMNPVKYPQPERFRAEVEQAMRRSIGSIQLSFYETTRDDAGHGQATQAVRDGADLVLAAGGDGTVREVASALAGGPVRMGIIPGGTGNLLARNLDVPLENVQAAVEHAITGIDHRIDVGWLQSGMSVQAAERAPKRIFLVISGYGADAEIVGATDVKLKRRFGWPAYVLAGLGKLAGRSHEVVVSLPGGTEQILQARTVLIGNVGKLPGGITLMPDATIDNGHLEILALGWRGAAGFGQILTQVVNPRLSAGPRLSTMQRFLTRSVTVASSKPMPVQLDGDTEAPATHLIAAVEPAALIIRAGDR
ncbi:diacylglycerol/lipid kinase family protein [Brachybacterium hainanense]|uniref:Diacylglycerol/lipid kinase family protein n=1 Tax=Brachybacterium hainanense TaxID=1541174 RepID=A0ABV6RHZ8_9MICO